MDPYIETFKTWDKVAERYQEKFMHLDLYDATYDYICSAVGKQGAKLLEIGCGPGNITKYLLSKRPDLQILGIDVAPSMVALAGQNNPSARFEIMDCRDLASLRDKFDAIIGGFCLPYLSEPDCAKLIANCCDLLNQDGLVYLSFVEGNPSQSGFQVGSSGDRVYFFYHNLSALERLLKEHGFGDLNRFVVEYRRSDTETELHTILTARKC